MNIGIKSEIIFKYFATNLFLKSNYINPKTKLILNFSFNYSFIFIIKLLLFVIHLIKKIICINILFNS